MTTSRDAGSRQSAPAPHTQPHPPNGGAKVRALARAATRCLASLAVMMPWPLLGILLTRSFFDEPSEASMLFGGITMFPLMVLALFGSVSKEMLVALVILVWVATALIPSLLHRRMLGSVMSFGVLLAMQSAISLAQAAMGALLVIGKNI